jgi:hypothetical protein
VRRTVLGPANPVLPTPEVGPVKALHGTRRSVQALSKQLLAALTTPGLYS